MTTIDRARFEAGLTYEQYKDQMTRNRDRVEANEARVEIEAVTERPASVTERRREQRKRIHTEHPEFGQYGAPPDALPEDVRARLTAEITARRDADTAWANREVVSALRGIVERSPAAA